MDVKRSPRVATTRTWSDIFVNAMKTTHFIAFYRTFPHCEINLLNSWFDEKSFFTTFFHFFHSQEILAYIFWHENFANSQSDMIIRLLFFMKFNRIWWTFICFFFQVLQLFIWEKTIRILMWSDVMWSPRMSFGWNIFRTVLWDCVNYWKTVWKFCKFTLHSVKKREILSHLKILCLINSLVKLWENFRNFQTHSQCGNYGNLLSLMFDKKRNVFTDKVTKELISRNIFQGKYFSGRENFSFFHTVLGN